MQLTLKSTNAVTLAVQDTIDFNYYDQRVKSDGGVVMDTTDLIRAFTLANTLGLTPSKVFSAVSARWGVKYDPVSSSVTKLYSLFGEAGDIEIASPQNVNGTVKMNTSAYTFPSIYFSGNHGNRGVSKGIYKHSATKNIASCSVTGRASVTTDVLRGEAFSTLTDVGDTYQLLDSYLFRATTEEQLKYYAQSFHRSGSIATTENFTDLAAIGTFTNESKLELYKNGLLIGSDNTITKTLLTDFKLIIGNRQLVSINVDSALPLKGNFIENWLLSDVTEATVIALTQAQNQKYRI